MESPEPRETKFYLRQRRDRTAGESELSTLENPADDLVPEAGLSKLLQPNRMPGILQYCGSNPWQPPIVTNFWVGQKKKRTNPSSPR